MSASPHHHGVSKKHKKHKSERRDRLDSPIDRPPGLKLILKVGSSATPEHTTDFGYNPTAPSSYSVQGGEDMVIDQNDPYSSLGRLHHKKSKKKKKKKDKSKSRERKHRHHHKEKKKKREEFDGLFVFLLALFFFGCIFVFCFFGGDFR